MRACVLHAAEDLRVDEIEMPTLADDSVMVKVRSGGICGSDLHYYFSGGVGDFRLKHPMILGHEVAGEVTRIGKQVSKVRVGQRVAVNPSRPCGVCSFCARGERNLCSDMRFFGSAARNPHVQGGFAEFLSVPASQCVPVPDDFPFHLAAFAEPLSVALHALNRAGPVFRKNVVVVGAGVIGALVALCALKAGAASVTAIDIVDESLALLREQGVHQTINARTQPEALEALQRDRGTVDVAWEAAGNGNALETCIACVKPGGRIVQIGQMPPGGTPIPVNKLMSKEITLTGSFRFIDEFELAVQALMNKDIDVSPIFTGSYGTDELGTAFHIARDRTQSMKVQIHF